MLPIFLKCYIGKMDKSKSENTNSVIRIQGNVEGQPVVMSDVSNQVNFWKPLVSNIPNGI